MMGHVPVALKDWMHGTYDIFLYLFIPLIIYNEPISKQKKPECVWKNWPNFALLSYEEVM